LIAAKVFLCSGMRSLLALIIATLSMPLVSCTTDPDLDPKPTTPETTSRRVPWNQPVTGQGGGAFGAMPNQQLRR